MQFYLSVIILFISASTFLGCAPNERPEPSESSASDRLAIWVTLAPQKSIIESIAGDLATVELMVRSGQSPETYSPSVPQMAALAKADIYFGIGMPLEKRILSGAMRSMPQLQFVQTSEIIEVAHDHAHHEGCVHGDVDPHVWMDPLWMIGFIEQVRGALSEKAPDSADVFAARAADLSQQLLDVDQSMQARFKPYAGRSFYINHPSLGHFAERYGLVQRSIEYVGSAPSARQIKTLIDAAKAESVGAIFTQPEFGRSSADVLARALGVPVVELDVLSTDYFGNLLDIAQALEDSFK